MTFASWPGFRHLGDFGRNGSECLGGWKSDARREGKKRLTSISVSNSSQTKLTPLDIRLRTSPIILLPRRRVAYVFIAAPHKLVGFLQQTLGRAARLVHPIQSRPTVGIATWTCAVVSQVWQRATDLLRRFYGDKLISLMASSFNCATTASSLDCHAENVCLVGHKRVFLSD